MMNKHDNFIFCIYLVFISKYIIRVDSNKILFVSMNPYINPSKY